MREQFGDLVGGFREDGGEGILGNDDRADGLLPLDKIGGHAGHLADHVVDSWGH